MSELSFEEGCLVWECPGRRVFNTPLCLGHILDAWRWVEAHPHAKPTVYPEPARQVRKVERERTSVVRDGYSSLVYYVRMPSGRIKIGTSTGVASRVFTLGARWPQDVLAVEWGGRRVERARHADFAETRCYDGSASTEEFADSAKLLAHIEDMRAAHGDPVEAAKEQARRALEARATRTA